jgi:hypothetical protein
VQCWVVVLEVGIDPRDAVVESRALNLLRLALSDLHPRILHSADRYAIQLEVTADGFTEALSLAITRWSAASQPLEIGGGELVRAEVLTRSEFERELQAPELGSPIDADRRGQSWETIVPHGEELAAETPHDSD